MAGSPMGTFGGIDAAEWERDGYAHVDLFEPSLVAELERFVLAGLPSPVPEFFASPAHAWGQAARRFHLDVVALAEGALAERFGDAEVFMVAATVKGPRGGTVQYHSDWTYTDERVHRPVFLWVPLVDVDDDNGVLRVVPGSHVEGPDTIRPSTGPARWQINEMFQEQLHARSVARPMRAGQALAFDPATLHGSLENLSGSVRPALTIALAPAGAELVHFHLSDDGILTGHRVDAAFFTEHDYARRPAGYPEVEPWARAIGPADFERTIAAVPERPADTLPPLEVRSTPPPPDEAHRLAPRLRSAGPDGGQRIDHVLRRDGAWFAAPVPGTSLDPTDLDAVIAMVAAAGPEPGGAGAGPPGAGLGAASVVEPVWAWVGRIVPGGALVEGPDGDELVLDVDDLRVVDACGTRSTVSEVAARVGRPVASTGARIARLAPAALRVVSAEPAEPVASPWAPSGRPATPVPAGTMGRGAALRSRTRRVAGEVALRVKDRVMDRVAPRLSLPTTSTRAPASRAPEQAPATATATEPVREPEPTTAPTAAAPAVALAPSAAEPPAAPVGRVPVYTIWHDTVGPSLAHGMLTAAARVHDGGALNASFEIRRPEHASAFLADVARREGPAILLCSDYVWSLDDNLAAARAALASCPELLVIHGGPSSPKYEADAVAFLRDHADVAHVLVRGEGERVLSELLAALAAHDLRIDAEALSAIGGLSFVDPDTGSVVRTPDQERIADLDSLPSPYLTGEFDDIDHGAWQHCLSIETNRGCPYGCTFCDWGSSTLSRIRRFDLDRVRAELEWAASRHIFSLNISDANFGIMSRDVEIAKGIADVKRTHGFPELVGYYPAKNTTKYLAPIMDVLLDAGIGPAATISLQTTDPGTLEAVERSNISTDHYVALAAEMRRRHLPLQGDLLIGLPGQTVASYKADLQHHLDHEILARTWQVRVLPNAPMNAPEYRERFGMVTDSAHRVMSTTTFDRDDRARMLRLRTADTIAERFGLLRHVMRYLQWDRGVPALDLVERMVDVAATDPLRFPTLTWVFDHFDLVQTVAVGWGRFYGEVERFVAQEFGVTADPAWRTVLRVQRFLMPAPGRTFPDTIELEHDYVGWYVDATEELFRSGHATSPDAPLSARGPGTLTVEADPLGLCHHGLLIPGDPRDELFENDFAIGANSAYELASPLMRLLPHVAFAAAASYSSVSPVRRPYEAPPAPRRIPVVAGD